MKQKNKGTVQNFKNYILAGACGVLAVLSILMTIETATSGLTISKLQNNEETLLSQKRDLEGILVKTLSVNNLQEKSKELGFGKPATLVYVTTEAPVAKLP